MHKGSKTVSLKISFIYKESRSICYNPFFSILACVENFTSHVMKLMITVYSFYFIVMQNSQRMLKLNTRNCSLYIPLYMQKTHQFLSSIKRDAHKRKLVPLSASRCSYFFAAPCYASAVLAMGLCLSVGLSVTSPSSSKTAERIELVFGV